MALDDDQGPAERDEIGYRRSEETARLPWTDDFADRIDDRLLVAGGIPADLEVQRHACRELGPKASGEKCDDGGRSACEPHESQSARVFVDSANHRVGGSKKRRDND